MLHGDVVDHLHDQHGLAHPCSTEETYFAAFRIGFEQIDDLDARFQEFDFRVLHDERRGGTVDGIRFFGLYRAQAVNRLADYVEHPAQNLFADWDDDG